MNVYELIDDLYHAHSYLRAGDDNEWPYMPVRQMLDAYDALAPDWANAPEWAKWYAIDADGSASWWELEPVTRVNFWTDQDTMGMMETASNGRQSLPVGIDWRLCKWSREGAK